MVSPRIGFGDFLFDTTQSTLWRGGELVALGGREAALLQTLLEARGDVVRKDALLDRVWPGVVVEEGNLAVQVRGLRTTLGDRADGEPWIVTVPRIGYRLPLPPEVLAPHGDERVPHLAVLAFDNLSNDPGQDYFADGVVEDIITALSRFRSFAVLARNSSFAWRGKPVDVREVSRKLGARYLLEGSVRRAGGKLRITAQLIDGSNGGHLWARNFDGTVDDIFDVQDRIIEEVVGIIEPLVQQAEIARSRRERPGSLAAYDLYLRALPRHAAMTPRDNAEALDLLDQALALDPTYAIALKVAIDALSCRIGMGWPALSNDDEAHCLELTERALASAGGDASVVAQCGAVFIFVGRDYERGLALVDRALAANPNNVDALASASNAYLHCGDINDAIRCLDHALRLSPADPLNEHFLLTGSAHARLIIGEPAAALAWAERSHAINPHFNATYWLLVAANVELGRMDEARRWLSALRTMQPEANLSTIRKGQPDMHPERIEPVLAGLRAAGLPD